MKQKGPQKNLQPLPFVIARKPDSVVAIARHLPH